MPNWWKIGFIHAPCEQSIPEKYLLNNKDLSYFTEHLKIRDDLVEI